MIAMAKEIRINVRTTEQIKADLEITARLKGLTVSALVNSLVVKAIREEKEREPQAFVQKETFQTKQEIASDYGFNNPKDEVRPVETPDIYFQKPLKKVS